MTLKQYTLNELTDSRLLYDKNPPKFMFFVIALVFLMLGGAITASIYIHKPYVVKAQGMVTSSDKATLTVNIAGTIISFNLKEGQSVKAGDTIMTFDDSQTRIQMEQYAAQVDYYNNQITLYNRCVNEINNGTNTFSKSNPDEAAFYYQIELMQSKTAQYNISDAQYKTAGYTDDQIKTQQAQNASQRDSVKYQAISDLNTQRASLEAQLQSATAQRDAYKKLLDEYSVKAKQSGVVHLSGSIKPGMILQAGTAIGTISTDSPSDLSVETYVSAQDRSKISLNSPVEIAVSGVLQSDYGVIKGKITAIDTDATVDQTKGTVYYKAEIKPNKTVLKNKIGQQVSLKSGMVTQSNIQYQDSTWFNWILEQIGLKSV
jgi:multidrug efflux pump subunit AcrA (membrane-fusion protein)